MHITIDARRKAILPGDAQATVAFAANHFIQCAKSAIALHGAFFVALSGGSTPKQIYEKLASSHKDFIDWHKVYLFWSDERAVPATHPDSNYKMAMDAAFHQLNVPSSHIFRMKGEGDIALHATEYEMLINEVLEKRPFDLIMLGVGEDGHTASLFPHTKGLLVKNKLVIANEVPEKNCFRMTFTYPLINNAHNICIYAMGANKMEIIKKVLFTEDYPASHVGDILHPATWVLDNAAGRFLFT